MAADAEAMPVLIDTHAHLDAPKLARDESGVLARARSAGVGVVVAVGADMGSSRAAVAIAARRPEVLATVGVHPHDASDVTPGDLDELHRLAAEPRVVAVGECGLDFFRDLSPRGVQRRIFAQHLALAREAGLPVVVHCRDAYAECLDILRREWPPPVRGVMHCFLGDQAVARQALELGMVLGIGGSLTFPREETLRQTVAGLPLERLVVETDAPYLTPRPKRGSNEPAYVRFTAERLAEVIGVDFARVAETTTRNARILFDIHDGS
jgi:TatD DNase family protein